MRPGARLRHSPGRPNASPARAQHSSSTAPSPLPLPPRQSMVYGPHTTTVVTTTVREEVHEEENRRGSAGHRRCVAHRENSGEDARVGVLSSGTVEERESSSNTLAVVKASRLRGSATVSPLSTRVSAEEGRDLRELRQTRSLFICGRGLLSLRHIQHLSEMLSLRFLSVHMNNIKALEEGCLRTLTHLVELDLSANELSDIPCGCWAGLGRLERLNLSSNQLTRLGPTAFASLPSLQWLSLGFNNLSDVAGLQSVPATAPLAYIDLCANRIATVEELASALEPHRLHVQELRLASPAAPSHSGAVAGQGTVGSRDLPEASPGDHYGAVPAYWAIQENPCCFSGDVPLLEMHDKVAEERGAYRSSVAAATGRMSQQDPAPRAITSSRGDAVPPYVERLLSYFPHLLVVNGISYGVDPLQLIQQQQRERQPEEASAGGVGGEEDLSGIVGADAARSIAQLRPLGGVNDVVTPSSSREKATARKVSGVNPDGTVDDDRLSENVAFARLLSQPLPRLRSSSSSSSLSSSSTFPPPTKRVRHRHGRPLNSRGRRDALRGARDSLPQDRRSASADVSLPSHASRGHRREGPAEGEGWVGDVVARPPVTVLDESPAILPSVSAAPPHPQQGRVEKASPTTGTIGPLQRQHHSNVVAAKPRRASLRRRVSSSSSTRGSPLAAAASSPGSATSPSTGRPQPLEDGEKLSPSVAPHVRRLRFERVATDAASPSSAASVVESGLSDEHTPTSSSGKSIHASGASPSVVDVADSSTPTPASAMTASSAPSPETCGEPSTASQQRKTARGVYRLCSKVEPALTLPWKPKQVSRGTCTDALTSSASVSREAQLADEVEHLQEQLKLRSTTIAELRRHLDLTRTQYVESQREARVQEHQLRCQVSALKDELARRGEETHILQRKEQAQLNKAVESVKQEWTRRLEESEQRSSRALSEMAASWEVQVKRAEDDAVQLRHTVSVRTAQVATLERQNQVMEEEIQTIRAHGVVLRREWAARTGFLLAEAGARQAVEWTAASSLARISRLFFRAAAQVQVDMVLKDAYRERQAREELERKQATWHTRILQYKEALCHATRETSVLRRGGLSDEKLTPRNPDAAPAAAPDAALMEVEAALPGTPPALGGGNSRCIPDEAKRVTATATKEHEEIFEEGNALVATPIHPPLAPPTLSPSQPFMDHGGVLSRDLPMIVAAEKVNENDLTVPPASQGDNLVSAYWKSSCARVEAQLQKVETALHVSAATQESLAAENTRLLTRVEALEEEKMAMVARLRSVSDVADKEKENLLRTLHTLRDDLEKKDAAFDTLEEEARAKLNEKRRRIAELEEAVDALTAQQNRSSEMNCVSHDHLEAAQSSVARLKSELAEANRRLADVTQREEIQVPDLERKQRELSELLATRNAEAHQYELEKKALVHALTMAREQLVHLHEAYLRLSTSNTAANEQCAKLQVELEGARRQVKDTQEASRAKQKTTFEMLSRLMLNDAV